MSQVRLVVVMDPIEAINPAKDSTLAILLAAQTRGWQLHYAELGDLWLRDGVAWGSLAPLEVFERFGALQQCLMVVLDDLAQQPRIVCLAFERHRQLLHRGLLRGRCWARRRSSG